MHNPTAGNGRHSSDALLALLVEAGHDAAYQSAKAKGFAAALEEPAELVVVAGGDGTVGKVAKRLSGRGTPIAILPLGTANNVATSLGVSGSPRELIAGWPAARRRRVRLGVVRGPWGERRFLEGVGLGLFAWTIRRMRARKRQGGDPEGREKIERALQVVREVLRSYKPRCWEVALDGEDVSGDYLAVEAMNMRCVGPNLVLAPGADPGDDRLDVVLVAERDLERLEAYLSGRLRGSASPPRLAVRRARSVRLAWDPRATHVDDKVDFKAPHSSSTLDVRVDAGGPEFLVPGRR